MYYLDTTCDRDLAVLGVEAIHLQKLFGHADTVAVPSLSFHRGIFVTLARHWQRSAEEAKPPIVREDVFHIVVCYEQTVGIALCESKWNRADFTVSTCQRVVLPEEPICPDCDRTYARLAFRLKNDFLNKVTNVANLI